MKELKMVLKTGLHTDVSLNFELFFIIFDKYLLASF